MELAYLQLIISWFSDNFCVLSHLKAKSTLSRQSSSGRYDLRFKLTIKIVGEIIPFALIKNHPMHKQLLFTSAFLLWLGCLVAQPTVRVLSVETPQSSQVAIPVQLFDIQNTEGIQLGLQWEQVSLQLDSVGFSPDYPMTDQNFSYPETNELAFDWLIDYWETVRDGDTLFLMYFTVLANCGQPTIELSTEHIPFRISRGGQDIADLQFVPGRVDIGAFERITGDTTICVGDNFELSIDAPLATSFNWSGTDGILSCTDCPKPTVSELYGEATFSVEIEGPVGCTDTAYVFVNARSYLDFGLLPFSNSPVCLGDTIYFDPNVFGGQSYSWQGPLGFESSEMRPRLQADSVEMSGTYELQLVDQYGCEAGATFDVIVADSIGSVEVDFQYGGCEGGSATMEIGAIDGGQGPFTFQINGGEALPIPDGPFEVPFAGNITLTITAASGCTWRRNYFRPELLTVNIQELQAPPCQGPDFDGALTAQVQGGVVPYAFVWSTAATSQTISGLQAAVYELTVTDANGCTAVDSYTLVPSPIDSISANPIYLSAGESSQLAVFGKNFSSVSWSPAALLDNPNSINPNTVNLTENTTFTVSVEDESGCLGEASVTINVQEPNLNWNIVDSLLVGQQGIWCDPTQNPLGLQLDIDGNCNLFQGGVFEAQVGPEENCLEYMTVSPGTDTLCFTACLNTTDICGTGRLRVAVAPEGDPVWPGDTNDDGIADQYDVLNFGFLLDTLQGPSRPSASLDWMAQPAFDWSRFTPEQDNYKHIDTDGDGTPDHLDLDSDGDGCSDSVETSNTPIANNDIVNHNTGTDANNNGLLDQFEDGTLSIIDYKTGKPPTLRALKAGYAPQLPLEAAIAVKGGFYLLSPTEVSELSYWQLSGGELPGKITFYNEAKKIDVMTEASNAYKGLIKLVTTFDLPDTPYLNKPRPEAVGYGEFDHLARTKEWGER